MKSREMLLILLAVLVVTAVVYFVFFWEVQVVVSYNLLNVSRNLSCDEYALGSVFVGQSIDSVLDIQCHNVCDRASMNSKGFGCGKGNLMVCRCGFLG